MTPRYAVSMVSSALMLCGIAHAMAQAPFTIRRPPDGAVVREQVRVEIPRGSIGPGGFVAFYIDDKFHSAIAPQEDLSKPFTFVWDTKRDNVPDGEHTIRAVLYEPAGGDTPGGVVAAEKNVSEVRVTVANKIKNGPNTLTLRYKYPAGTVLEYARNARSLIVGGVSATGVTTSDQVLNEMRSRLLLGIEDSRPAQDVALIRNKLTRLSLLEEGQEITFPEGMLSGSMYQEVNSQGRVLYETGTGVGMEEFTLRGLPVNNTLELPLLPLMQVSVGQTWQLPGQRLDIPGLPPAMQPRVTLTSKFEGLEWENGYPTARIRQTYEGDYGKPLIFNGIEVTSPKINYERDIYIAYKSGTLVKIKRTLTISGRTTSTLAAPPDTGMAGGSGAFAGQPGGPTGGPMMAGGLAGAAGGTSSPYASGGPPSFGAGGPYGGGMRGGMGAPYSSGPPSFGAGGPYGSRQGRQGSRGGFPGYGGPPSFGAGGPYGMSGGRMGISRGGSVRRGDDDDRGFASGAPYGGSRMGFPTMMGSGGMTMGGVGTQERDYPVTLRSITETFILTNDSKTL
ncbi:MAG: hypothetical protein RMJ43_13235 [Chloroherpetonaceae bacterium]|nr:hypothetical protein [Chthonomonadaceae bacterium]MDW8208791.1 hypothetical protein [Chloroherpetonaceae bacterium]